MEKGRTQHNVTKISLSSLAFLSFTFNPTVSLSSSLLMQQLKLLTTSAQFNHHLLLTLLHIYHQPPSITFSRILLFCSRHIFTLNQCPVSYLAFYINVPTQYLSAMSVHLKGHVVDQGCRKRSIEGSHTLFSPDRLKLVMF